MDTVDESLRERPFVWAVKTEKIAEICSYCLRSEQGLDRVSNYLILIIAGGFDYFYWNNNRKL